MELDGKDRGTDPGTDRRLFVWLFLGGLAGSLIGVPWAIAVLRAPAAGGAVDPRAMWLSAVAEALFLLAPASAVGVWLGKKVGLGPRLGRELVAGVPGGWGRVRLALLPTVLAGLAVGVLGYLGQNAIPNGALAPGLDNPSTLETFLRTLSAGVTEEILFRLGLMTLFVWAIRSMGRRPALHGPSLWVGNLLAALLFAAAHLPQLTFQAYGWRLLLPFVAVSSTAGMVMGWLYQRYGLISAVVAHWMVDVVVYVIPRLLALIP
jgi:hypothetical protein